MALTIPTPRFRLVGVDGFLTSEGFRFLTQLATGKLRTVRVASLPTAQEPGEIIFVEDEAGGAVIAFSDGTDWRRVTDRAVVS